MRGGNMDMRLMEAGITTAAVAGLIVALIAVHMFAGSYAGVGYAIMILLFCIAMALIGFKFAEMACGSDECED